MRTFTWLMQLVIGSLLLYLLAPPCLTVVAYIESVTALTRAETMPQLTAAEREAVVFRAAKLPS